MNKSRMLGLIHQLIACEKKSRLKALKIIIKHENDYGNNSE